MSEKVRILFLSANPVDLVHLRLDQEAREIDSKIRSAEHREAFELIPKLATRPADLQEALLRHKPHVLHFSGHGNKNQGIFFEDDNGNATPVRKEVLASLLRILKDNIRVMVLNACYSKGQSASITEVIDYTIVMNKPVGDVAAVAFAASFYRALAYGRSIQDSFHLSVNELTLLGIAGDDTPELIIRRGVNPQDDVLVPSEPPSTVEPATSSSGSGGNAVHLDGGRGSLVIGGNVKESTLVVGGINIGSGQRES